jgi:Chaperone of endosialidase
MNNRYTIYTTIVLALGCFALSSKTQAVSPSPDGGYPGGNTAEGTSALFSLTTGTYNTAVGFLSLRNITTARFNTGIGAGTLLVNMAEENTATGAGALLNNTIGFQNTASGGFALQSSTTGHNNTGIGVSALVNNTTGSDNVALGNAAGFNATTGVGNVYIGSGMLGVPGESNACYIASIFNATSVSGVPVYVNSESKLGTLTSSKRFKEDIKAMDKVSEVLFSLKPVSFRYKKEIDSAGTPQVGLVAEEVEKVNPNLVVRDKEGKSYSVRYDQVNAMLLNEFLKEHSKVQQLEATVAQQRNDFEATITELKKEMKRVAARFEEQDARIQKISTRVELSEVAASTTVSAH